MSAVCWKWYQHLTQVWEGRMGGVIIDDCSGGTVDSGRRTMHDVSLIFLGRVELVEMPTM